jgi:hypothetical protein
VSQRETTGWLYERIGSVCCNGPLGCTAGHARYLTHEWYVRPLSVTSHRKFLLRLYSVGLCCARTVCESEALCAGGRQRCGCHRRVGDRLRRKMGIGRIHPRIPLAAQVCPIETPILSHQPTVGCLFQLPLFSCASVANPGPVDDHCGWSFARWYVEHFSAFRFSNSTASLSEPTAYADQTATTEGAYSENP